MSKKFEKGKMVPVPSHAIIPERDIDKSPFWSAATWASTSAACGR